MNSRMQGFERDTVMAIVNSKRVWLLHAVANALLMVAFFYWTRIPEESGLQFSLTVVSGLLIAFVTLWLHSTTFDYFRPAEHSLKASLRRSAARVPAFLVWSVIFGLGLWLIGQLWHYDEQTGGWVRHLLPGFLRRAATPRSAFSVTFWLVWLLYFVLWPIVFLPVGAQVAIKNFRGFYTSVAFRPLRELRFWIVYVVCFIVGAYVPYKLVWMIPTKPSTLNEQTWSMVARLGVGYLLMVTAWLVLCAAIMRACDGDAALASEPEQDPIAVTPVG
ncbi:MAG: hypothetical protein LAO56_21660 [Acidobacteriia bacterium]|nr:hypothetical protein [Terriglobia bacterium]